MAMTKIEQKLRADPRVEDIDHDEDGWWVYLQFGMHTEEGVGSHLIHEDSPTAVWNVLRLISPKTHACDCPECKMNLNENPNGV